jgi:acetoin utilization deacetylase AcuC-like enzyme
VIRAWASARHSAHRGNVEFSEGRYQPSFESVERAERVRDAFLRSGLGPLVEPPDRGLAPLRRVHDDSYLTFLRTAWERWQALGRTHPALPMVWHAGAGRPLRAPRHIDGLLGFHAQDAACSIVAGTWEAVCASAQCALAAAHDLLEGAPASFALCRPPGHHATANAMGGFCYLNNAAVAAQALRDAGLAKVAVLDVDYHHGNGTQSIFWQRGDVFFASLHADPHAEYPFFCGHADERGAGDGDGATLNMPLPPGTTGPQWLQALAPVLQAVGRSGAQALVVSLGVDTYEHDPISRFRLRHEDYTEMGHCIAALGLPTVYVLEGGYATEAIGDNVVQVLGGHLGARAASSTEPGATP